MNKISFSTLLGLIGTLSAFFLITFFEFKYLAAIFFINLLISLFLLLYLNIENIGTYNKEQNRLMSFFVPLLDSKKKIVVFCIFFLFLLISMITLFNFSEKRNYIKNSAKEDAVQIIALLEDFISNSYRSRNEAYFYLKNNGYNFAGIENIDDFKNIYNIEYLTNGKSVTLDAEKSSGVDLNLFKSLINENDSINVTSVNNEKILLNIISGGITDAGIYEYINFVYDLTPFCKKLKKVFGYDFIFTSSFNKEDLKDNYLVTDSSYDLKEILKTIEKSESGFFIQKDSNKEFVITSGELDKDLFKLPSKIFFIKEIKKGYPGNIYLFIEIFLCTSICILSIIFLYTYTDKMNRIVSDAVSEKEEYLSLSLDKDKSIKAVLDSIEEGIIITDISGFIQSANMSAGMISGFLAEDVINRNIKEFYKFESSSLSPFLTGKDDFFDDIIKSRKVVFEASLKNSDKRDINIVMNSAVISSEYNEAIGLVFIIRNVVFKEKLNENISFTGYEAIEKIGTGFWRWNMEDGKILFSNAWKRLIGIPNGSEKNIEEMFLRIHPNEKERVLVDLYEHINGETDLYYSEHRMKRDDGSFIWVCERGKVIKRNEAGEAREFICTTSSINLRRNEQFFLSHRQLFFMNGPVIYFRWKNEKNLPVECVSSNVKELMGYSESEFTSKVITYKDIMDENAYNIFMNDFNSLENLPASSYEKTLSIYTGDGRKKDFLHHLTIIKDEDGKTSQFVGYVIDIEKICVG